MARGPLELDDTQSVTVSFLAFVTARLLHVFNMRAPDEPLWSHQIVRSPVIWGALAVSAGLTLLAVLVPPLAQILGLVAPTSTMWALSLGAGLLVLVIGHIGLWLWGRRSR